MESLHLALSHHDLPSFLLRTHGVNGSRGVVSPYVTGTCVEMGLGWTGAKPVVNQFDVVWGLIQGVC